MSYDEQNIFAKILRGEIPCDKIYEDEYVLAFKDVAPQAPVHVLVIPKEKFISMVDFAAKASVKQTVGIISAIGKVATQLGLDLNGYRLITNVGIDGSQEVLHLHFHILAGKPMGKLVGE